MASQGPLFPGTTASLANAGTNENAEAWVSPGNIVSDNGTEATITAATYDSPDISQLLVASNFGFTIPTGSTILGIVVEIDRRNSAGAASDNRVQLAKGTTFASLVGTNKADTALDWPTTTAVATYGTGTTDLWGATWTVAEINASSFAVMLSVQADAANTDIQVDYIRITVHYTPPNATGTAAPDIDAPAVSATGKQTLTGTAAPNIDAPAVAATGKETFTGTGAPDIDAPAIAATGTSEDPATTGTAAVDIDAPSISSTGKLTFTGTGAPDIDAPAISATGKETLSGTAAPDIDAPSISATAKETFTGTGDPNIDAPAISATGNAESAEGVTGSGAVTIAAPAVAGTGTLALAGTAAFTIAAPSVAASGLHTEDVTGSADVSIDAPTLAALGNTPVTGDGHPKWAELRGAVSITPPRPKQRIVGYAEVEAPMWALRATGNVVDNDDELVLALATALLGGN